MGEILKIEFLWAVWFGRELQQQKSWSTLVGGLLRVRFKKAPRSGWQGSGTLPRVGSTSLPVLCCGSVCGAARIQPSSVGFCVLESRLRGDTHSVTRRTVLRRHSLRDRLPASLHVSKESHTKSLPSLRHHLQAEAPARSRIKYKAPSLPPPPPSHLISSHL
jgi:hypothetical protein